MLLIYLIGTLKWVEFDIGLAEDILATRVLRWCEQVLYTQFLY
jgi:hypothetical protein